jgi:hypothetical protein
MKDSKNPIASRWQRQPPLKTNFYLSVFQMKSSSTCLIPASLCEGSFIYFYVESPPSTFMHRLREHSCHSEFNVHSPEVYHWLIHDYGFLVLKLFVSSCPLKLEGVLCIYVLLFHEGQAENHLICFSIWFEHTFDFHCFIIHDLLFVFLFMFTTWLLSFYCQDYVFYAHALSSWSSTQCFTSLIKIVMVHVTSKFIILLSLTYSRTSRS